MTIVSVPHKMLFAGSYLVLDGAPSLGLAIGPRMTLHYHEETKQPWNVENPFAQAVWSVLQQHQYPNRTLSSLPPQGEWKTTIPEEVARWGVGSSAAFTTALLAAVARHWGLELSPKMLFNLARNAHRKGQSGKGSGVDIAACTYGGLVALQHAHTENPPDLCSLSWPNNLGIWLLQSGQKADTRQWIDAYRALSTSIHANATPPLRRALDTLSSTFSRVDSATPPTSSDLLRTLAANSEAEWHWSQAVGIPLVTPLQRQIHDALSPLSPHVVIKALGAGGGDSIACFFDTTQIQKSLLYKHLSSFSLPIREVQVESDGVRYETSTSPTSRPEK